MSEQQQDGIARYFGLPVRREGGDVMQEYVQHPKGKFVTYEDAMAYAARQVAAAGPVVEELIAAAEMALPILPTKGYDGAPLPFAPRLRDAVRSARQALAAQPEGEPPVDQREPVERPEAPPKEKGIRIKYQELVYAACNLIEQKLGERRTVNVENFIDKLRQALAAPQPEASEETPETAFVRLLNELRQDEGASVTILCPNPDGPPNEAIEVTGPWTGWESKRYEGESVLQAVAKALTDKQKGT